MTPWTTVKVFFRSGSHFCSSLFNGLISFLSDWLGTNSFVKRNLWPTTHCISLGSVQLLPYTSLDANPCGSSFVFHRLISFHSASSANPISRWITFQPRSTFPPPDRKTFFFRFISSGRFALCLPHPDFIRHRKPADKLEPSVKSTPSLGMRFLLLDLLSTLDHYLVSKDFGKSFQLIQIIGLIPFCLIFR